MFPEAQSGPQTGNGFTTSAINQQNNSLLGNPQAQSTGTALPTSPIMNSTDPLSMSVNNGGGANPQMTNMIKALRGGQA